MLTIDEKERHTPKSLLKYLPKFEDIEKNYRAEKLFRMRQEYIERHNDAGQFEELDKLKNTRLVEHYSVNEMLGIGSLTPMMYFNNSGMQGMPSEYVRDLKQPIKPWNEVGSSDLSKCSSSIAAVRIPPRVRIQALIRSSTQTSKDSQTDKLLDRNSHP